MKRLVLHPLRMLTVGLLAVAIPATPTSAATASASTTPGTVTSVADLPPEQWLPGAARNLRLTYWSTGSDGQPAQVTGTLYVPPGRAPAGGWPVVSWTHGTIGLADKCKRSVAGRPTSEADQLGAWLGQGYAVAATDYVAMGQAHVQPYLDAKTEGRNAVDVVRAAHRIDHHLARRWVAIGHSQGGQAALGTASLASAYAPELDFRGAVSLAPGTHAVEAAILTTGPVPVPGYDKVTQHIAQIMAGLKAARPEWDMAAYLSATGDAVVADAARMCNKELAERTIGIAPSDLLKKPLALGDFASTAHPVMDVPMEGYTRPVFIGQGDADRTVSAEATLLTSLELRAHGVDVTYRNYHGVDHTPVLAASLKDTIPFVKRLFADPGRRESGLLESVTSLLTGLTQ